MKFIQECYKLCDCCQECNQQIPCAGVMQGGFCDEMCNCDDDITGQWDQDDPWIHDQEMGDR